MSTKTTEKITFFAEKVTEVPLAPVDPILGTKVAFMKDKDANKINLGIGAYRD